MTKLFASWPAILTKLSASFPATVCRISNLFWGQPRSHILRCPQIGVLFAVLFVDCEECNPCLHLASLPGARHAIVCILLSLEQSRVVDWVIAEFLLLHFRENPMRRILNSLSSCSDLDVLLHGDSVVQHYVVFFSPYGWQWLSVFIVGVPSWKYRWMASVFSVSGLVQHLLRMELHILSFRSSVLGSTASVFLDHVSRDWSDVTVVLVELRWTSRRLHISSTAAIDYSYFPVGIARHCCSEEFSQSSKISVLCKSAIKSCDALLNLLIFCVWLKSWMKEIIYVCGSRTSRSTFWLCSRVLYSAARLQKEVLQLSCGPRGCYRFPLNFSNSQDDLASWLCGSCGPCCEFDLSTTRGTLGVKHILW